MKVARAMVRRSGRAASALVLALVLAVLGGMLAPPARGAEVPELRILFPLQAEILAEGTGLARLELPPEVIRELRSDFSDLRIVDGTGREIPFLVDAGLARETPFETRREVRQEVRGEVLEVRRSVAESELTRDLHREAYEIAVPGAEPRTGVWDLVFETGRRSFVRRVTVKARTDAGEVVPLVADSSIFRLPNPLREKTRLTLPALSSSAGRILVELEGDEGSYLDPALSFESSRSFDPRERAAVELREVSRRRVDRHTVIEVERPQGLTPDLLLLETTTPAFSRQVVAWDEGPGSGDQALGEATLFRVEAHGRVEALEVPVLPARGDRLRLIVADGDSPPLAELQFLAVVRRPALIFALPAAPDGLPSTQSGTQPWTLLFGGGRAYRPQYDLATLAPPVGREVQGESAEVAERLYDPKLLISARLGEIGENPDFDPSPALAFAQRPGAPLDAASFRYRRAVTAEPSPEGLVRLRLGIEDLHRARPDLADLRLVDGEGRQWAYLLERAGARQSRALAVKKVTTKNGTSVYAIALPVESVELDRLKLDLPAPFFDRAFHLRGTRGEETVSLSQGRLHRRIGDPRPVILTFPPRRVDSLELTVEDGDDAALEITAVEARLPVADLYFAAPAGEYSLLLGQPEAEAPRYELARVRQVVLATASGEGKAGALVDNPAFSSWTRLGTAKGAQQALLWVALAAAVILLSWLTLRLARKEEGAARGGD